MSKTICRLAISAPLRKCKYWLQLSIIAMQEQSTGFICILTYVPRKMSVLLAKCMLYWAVVVKTNSSYGKMYRRATKIASTLELSNGGSIHMFHLNNLPWKQNGSVLLTNEQCTEELEWTQIRQIFLWQYAWSTQQYSQKNHPKF